MRELSDTLRATFRRVLQRENRRAAVRPGKLERISGFHSAVLGNDRDVVLYLPAGYEERQERRYPVLYMQDGQNLFEAQRAFIPGQHWRLREAADEAIGARTAEPMIIVGVDNAGPARIDEYTPTRDPRKKGGGKASDYARMLLEELKPEIDRRFRTRTEAGQCAVGGSSLGGLLALFLALEHPSVFGRAAVMSPSVWWDNRAILGKLDSFNGAARPRIWLDIGGREGGEALRDARELHQRLRKKGWSDQDLHFHEEKRGDHSERAWAYRARMMLEFLFPPAEF